ncbi:DUF6261 family protein [uncultured Parabacteroides sp.]|jgi:hypothetical protein|uniref:DUF6261 family protein n=1 Tax=uncultured Parabacteroides sp. TaxID=512312 RepID=UPI0025D02C14|nr:DUF6261 family protein [uncultured Parabacteroides sp.]
MKEIVEVPSLSRARNAEHFQFHANVLTFATPALATELKIESLQKTYADLFKREDDLYLQTRAYEETQAMNEKDRERDDLFIYVKQTVAAMLYSPVTEKKTAAQKIEFQMRPYKDAASKPAAENTAQVTNCLQVLESEANQAYITALGLTDVLPLLKQANNEFNELYVNRSDVKLGRVSNDSLKTIRTQVDDAYRATIKAVNALWLVNETITHDTAQATKLAGLIDNINALIVQFSETLSRRKAGTKPDIPVDPTPKPDPTPEPDPDDRPVIE